MKRKFPERKVTVIIRDDSPIWHAGDSPTYRTVVFYLTAEQHALLGLRCVDPSGVGFYETISQTIIEMKINDEHE